MQKHRVDVQKRRGTSRVSAEVWRGVIGIGPYRDALIQRAREPNPRSLFRVIRATCGKVKATDLKTLKNEIDKARVDKGGFAQAKVAAAREKRRAQKENAKANKKTKLREDNRDGREVTKEAWFN